MTACYCGQGIPDGGRKLTVAVDVDWGADDLRAPWSGEAVHCSFACLATWATERAAEHDDRVLTEGAHEAYGNEGPPA